MDVNDYTELRMKFGEESVMDKVKEELSELLVALFHNKLGKATSYEVVEEMIDVEMQLQKLWFQYIEGKPNMIQFYGMMKAKKEKQLMEIIYES